MHMQKQTKHGLREYFVDTNYGWPVTMTIEHWFNGTLRHTKTFTVEPSNMGKSNERTSVDRASDIRMRLYNAWSSKGYRHVE